MTSDEVADVVMSVGLSALGASGGGMLWLDAESSHYAVVQRAPDDDGVSRTRVPLEWTGALATCARTGRRTVLDAEVCVPLAVMGEPVGALALEFENGDMLEEEALALLDATADQCAQALHRARLYALERTHRLELERSNQMKDELIGVISHELRTPLSSILGWARMLKRGIVGNAHARDRALAAIERSATIQAQLVDELLDVSRIIAGRLELQTANVDLRVVIDSALDTVRPTLLAKPLDLQVQAPARAITVLGDAARLEQVMVNLLTNAIKFTPAGGRIELGLAADDAKASVWVRDNGIGIPPERLPYIFDRFKREDPEFLRRYGGLGLGLSIVRHIIQAHGGRVQARSEGPGCGTEVVLELPSPEFGPDRSPGSP
jgi:signal transduction histidine kinase